MSHLIWQIANDPENCAATHILVEERKHEDEIDEVFTCFTCLENGIRKAEQERIIKLLESLKGTCDNDCDDCRPYADKNDHYLSEVIALIKGENK